MQLPQRLPKGTTLSRKAIYAVLKEYGAISGLARDLGVTKGHLLRCLTGERTMTASIESACRAKAERLLRGERDA